MADTADCDTKRAHFRPLVQMILVAAVISPPSFWPVRPVGSGELAR
jgi:hypothetical protein